MPNQLKQVHLHQYTDLQLECLQGCKPAIIGAKKYINFLNMEPSVISVVFTYVPHIRFVHHKLLFLQHSSNRSTSSWGLTLARPISVTIASKGTKLSCNTSNAFIIWSFSNFLPNVTWGSHDIGR